MRPFSIRKTLAGLAIVTAGLALYFSAGTASAASTLVVPTQYASIQAAVNAANTGDTIKVRPGTYVEQVSIGKDLKITGSGIGSTIIRAPGPLVPNALGKTSIVDIHGGASVAMSKLTVSGPGAGTCAVGTLRAGIQVFGGAHLDLSFASVTHIHDTPALDCPPNGIGIRVGNLPSPSPGTANIRYSYISDYQHEAIAVLNAGSTATISHNVVTGPGLSTVVATNGITIAAGAVGTVSYNVVSGNACGSPNLCGTDFFNEFQVAGILGGPGTVISHNLLYGNQIGIYVVEGAEITQNVLVTNQYFGIALQDGSFTVSHNDISGGVGGVAVVALSADTEATLDHVNIAGTSGAPVQEFASDGFTTTVNIQ